MIPIKYFEQFIGKVICVSDAVSHSGSLMLRLASIEGDTLIGESVVDGTAFVDSKAVTRLMFDPGDAKFFNSRKSGADEDESDAPASALSVLFDRPRRITVPPETQAGIDALLADDDS